MKKTLLIVFLIICGTIATAQDSIRITGHFINNTRFAKVVVQKYQVGTVNVTAVPIEEGKFTITAPANLEPGVYKLQYSQSSLYDYVEVIINGKEKEIALSMDVLHPERPVTFTASEENKKWVGYKNEQAAQLQNIDAINQLLTNYSHKNAKIVKQGIKALVKLQKEYNQHQQDFIKINANTWAAAMVQNRPQYFTNPLNSLEEQNQNRRLHFWEGINTANPKLINTPLYTEHILNYLQEYINPQKEFTTEELEQGLKRGVDTIMQKFGANDITEKFALNYLQLGFKELGNETLLQYLDETYQHIVAQCNDEEIDKTAFEKRMEGYKTLKAGENAPVAVFNSPQGEAFTLKDVSNEKTILFFWASWCPNCEAKMPLINAFAKANNNISIVAISLDEDESAYKEVIKNYPNLIHSCDFKKWKGKIVEDYYVYGTPTFIVLDNSQKILGKYSSWEGVEKELK